MSDVALLLADGFEEMEAIAVIDILRRADVKLTTLGLTQKMVKGAHGLTVQADDLLEAAAGKPFDMVVLPGGPGVENLKKDSRVASLLEQQFSQKKWVGAICAAPTVLAAQGLLKGRTVTGYPGTEDTLKNAGAQLKLDAAVTDGNLITGRGPGTAIEFSLALVTALKGEAASKKVRAQLAQ
jgi:4-methyl-5(b-hydroxyethyl)-thiazole monophosphate biosynthesis